jgi:hypothetical protein
MGFWNCLITMDETWINIYASENKERSKEWKYSGSLCPKKFETQKATSTVLACLLGKRWNFACKFGGRGCNHDTKVLLTFLNKLKQQPIETSRSAFKRNPVSSRQFCSSVITYQKLADRCSETPSLLT